MSKKADKYIVQTLQEPANISSPTFKAMYERFAKRVLWMDSNVVEGAFQMNTAWYFGVPDLDPVFPEHTHSYDELIGFFGSNPDDPYDLGAKIEVVIDGETHLLTRTTMLFIPKGLPHMPLSIKRIDRPVFHFSIVMNPEYTAGAYQ
ncbi:hypothetical protein [Intestinimonas butyriciproducens]|uniref:Cupin domain-containing protein n=1 Tax=Intestinimonas butyriciproducens TaxID=1297617 RepID=A0A0S2W4G9_9FIRM|nr:hypothetical protein [Intestinimonas butyriciproducens]ALP94262.1 hypothetical protein IB211_01871 [Intestinimonas butyriciproducens]